MAGVSSVHTSITLRCLPAPPQSEHPLVQHLGAVPVLPPHPRTAIFSRRRNSTGSAITSSNKKVNSNKRKTLPSDHIEDGDLGEEAMEALFSMLEEDLKNDDLCPDDDDDEICDEDFAKLELELAEALGDDELLGSLDSADDHSNDVEDIDVNGNDNDDEEEDEREQLNLKTWQLRRLAYALKNGKRKSSVSIQFYGIKIYLMMIKALAADVCLDRSIVLKLLRDPSPNLVLMSASLPDKPTLAIPEPENKSTGTIPSETALDVPKPGPEAKMPVHVIQRNWSSRKRIKKVQLQTLEKVYSRTKRPTNAMISSIVHVTNLPRKRVVKWFEDKRTEDGVPEHRLPYQPAAAAAE